MGGPPEGEPAVGSCVAGGRLAVAGPLEQAGPSQREKASGLQACNPLLSSKVDDPLCCAGEPHASTNFLLLQEGEKQSRHFLPLRLQGVSAPVIVDRSRRPVLLEYSIQQPQLLHQFLQHPS